MTSKLTKRISKLATKAISQYRMIEEGDRLLVGVSGGNDSMVLMHLLTHLQRRAPISFTIKAVTVDAGWDGLDVPALHQYCLEQGWDHDVICFDCKSLLKDKGADKRPCSLCARLRRGKLHGYAEEHGYNKIVLGQHLDDICVSLLIGLFRGHGLTTMGPNVAADMNRGGNKRIVRPMAFVTKNMIDNCAREFEFPKFGECDYSEMLEKDGDRSFLENHLKVLAKRFPGIRQNMLRSMSDVRPGYLLDPRFLDYLTEQSPDDSGDFGSKETAGE